MTEQAQTTSDSDTITVKSVVGSVRSFCRHKGYGFLVPDDGSADVLVHISALRFSGFQSVKPGRRFKCDYLDRPKGRQAVMLTEMPS